MTYLAQISLLVAVGTAFALLIVLLARRGLLSMRYTLGWLFVAACILIGGLLYGLIGPIATWFGVSAAQLVLGSISLALLGLTVQLSITVSGLTEQVRILAESAALLRERIERDRAELSSGSSGTPE